METKKIVKKVETRGRPRKPDDGKLLKHFKVRLTEDEYNALVSIASKNSRNITNQVEVLIRDFVISSK